MASLSHLQLSLLLLPLFNLPFVSSSWSTFERERDYSNWISWNLKNYQQKATRKVESLVEAPPAGRIKALDGKLRRAEMNRVRIWVCQKGTGDFKTITEALNSIPLYNKRRVILMIKPGVYRYLFTCHCNLLCSSFARHVLSSPFIYFPQNLSNNFVGALGKRLVSLEHCPL